ncbi:MAG: hypothetical protein AAGA48_01595 [Myxococcota bacterium]
MSLHRVTELVAGRVRERLLRDLQDWVKRASDPPYRPHQSQIKAVSGSLHWLLQTLDEQAPQGPPIVQAARRRRQYHRASAVWTYFTRRWHQREVETDQIWLVAADDLAWIVLEPHPRAAPVPPLVHLSPDHAPFAMTRSFSVSGVRERHGAAFREVLSQLPVPLIGVPWSLRGSVADLALVVHEAAHVLVASRGGADQLQALLPDGVDPAWSAWVSESFADVFAAATLGDGYAATLSCELADVPEAIRNEAPEAQSPYPPRTVRMALCQAAAGEATPTWERWREAYPSADAMKPLIEQADRVANRLLEWNWEGSRLDDGLVRPPSRLVEQWREVYTGRTPVFHDWRGSLLASVAAAGSARIDDPEGWEFEGVTHNLKALQENQRLRNDSSRSGGSGGRDGGDGSDDPPTVDLSPLDFFS